MIQHGDTAGPDPRSQTQVCSSCGLLNSVASEYCTGCGAPLGVVTALTQVGDTVRSTHEWRVYGVETGIFGRQNDFDSLVAALQSAIDDKSCHRLTLTGTEGLGKTRLMAHFNERLDHLFEDAHLVSGACRGQAGPPYAALSRLVRSRFYIPEQQQGEHARQKLLDGVRATIKNPVADEIAHLIGYLIGLPWPDSHVYQRYGSDPARIVDRARGALIKFLEKDAERQPLVLVFEDLHLAGDESLQMVQFLHERLGASPILLVCIAQTALKNRSPWLFDTSDPRSSVLELHPLDDEAVHELARNILQRADQVPEELLELLCAHSFGHPLSIEVIIRVLIDEGIIDTRGNTWTIHTDRLTDAELPNNPEGLVRARLAGLTEEERNVLEKAALIGLSFWPGAIQALDRLGQHRVPDDEALWPGEHRERRILEVLRTLNRKDMIRRRRQHSALPGHREFTFKHGIERQIVYESLDPELRKRYHLIAAQWLEGSAHRAGIPDRFLESIAHHFEMGEGLERAATLYTEAGRQASRQFRNQTAVGHFERALAFLGEADLKQHIGVLHDIGTTLDLMGEPERSLHFYEELLQSAWLLGDRSKVAVAFNKLGRAHRTLGNYDRALSDLKRALALFRNVQDQPGVAASLTDIGRVHAIRGDYPQAESCYLDALELRIQQGDARSEALTRDRLGAVKLHSGQFKEALVLFRQSLELRRQSGDRRGVAESLNSLAVLCTRRGELDQALALYREAETIATEIGDRNLRAIALNNAGEVLLDRGELADAQISLEEAIETVRETGERRILFDAQRNLALLHVQREQWEIAIELGQRAHHIAAQLDAPVLIAIALRAQGEILTGAAEQGDEDRKRAIEAEDCFRKSLKLLEDIGNESELGQCLASYGQYLLGQGLLIQGRKRLEMAKDIFARLEMKRVLQETEQKIEAQ